MSRLATKYVDSLRSDGSPSDGPDDHETRSFDSLGLITAHTSDGTCHLYPGQHDESTTVPDAVLDAVDGVVVEEAATPYEHLRLDELREHRQYETVLRSNIDGARVPVFVLDLPPAGGREAYRSRYPDTLVELVTVAVVLAAVASLGLLADITAALVLCLPLVMLFIIHFVPTGVVQRQDYLGRVVRKFLAYGQVVNGYSLAAARSAAVAETLDTCLLPYLRAELGSRPELFLDYGFGHLDIYTYLRFPRLREVVLRCYRWHNVTDRDWSYLDAVLTFEFEGLTDANDVETADGIRHKRVLLRFEAPPGHDSDQPSN
jgi:hypothetical protein